MKTRYQILKDFLFYYGCTLSVIYAMQIASDVLGKKLPFSDSNQNPYAFFAILLLFLITQPYFEKWGRRKTIADYFPNAHKEQPVNVHEIIIPLQKEGMKAGLAVLSFMIVMLLGFFYMSSGLYKYLGHYITFFLQSIIILTVLLFLIGLICGILQSNEPEDLARLTHQGIWVRYFGFIPWDDIAILDKFQYGTPLISIGIRVKDLSKLSKQASFNGKMAIFWSKVFGYPPIIIANTTIDNETIMAFAKRFISPIELSD
jgi:hypothetical protein